MTKPSASVHRPSASRSTASTTAPPCGWRTSLVTGPRSRTSIRLLSWLAGEQRVHHLIDPSTGRPGGDDLRSVTVVGDDPADAEVWSKVLFLSGRAIADAAAETEIAALWIDADGAIGMSDAIRPYVIWERS